MKLPLDQQARSTLITARGERSLRDVAQQVGISHTQLARIESGQRSVDAATLAALAKYLGLEVKRKVVKVEVVKLVRAK